MSRFKVTRIWLFNPKAMDAKTRSTNIYTIMNSNHEAEGEDHYKSDDEVGPSQQEYQQIIATKVLNMGGIIVESNIECQQKEHKHQYYMEMPHNPPPIYNVEHEEHVVNLNDPTPSSEQELETQLNLTQEVMNFHNLLSLPHLLARRIVRKIHLEDYSQSHVVTFVDCLAILKIKAFRQNSSRNN